MSVRHKNACHSRSLIYVIGLNETVEIVLVIFDTANNYYAKTECTFCEQWTQIIPTDTHLRQLNDEQVHAQQFQQWKLVCLSDSKMKKKKNNNITNYPSFHDGKPYYQVNWIQCGSDSR